MSRAAFTNGVFSGDAKVKREQLAILGRRWAAYAIRALRSSRDARGFALLPVLLIVLALGAGVALTLPRALHWYHAALVRREAEVLVGDIRYLQQLSRLGARPFGTDGYQYGVSQLRPELRPNQLLRKYELWGPIPAEGEAVTKLRLLKRHTLAPGVHLSPNREAPLAFGVNGSTKVAGNLHIFHEEEPADGLRVIVDTVGRIRVEADR